MVPNLEMMDDAFSMKIKKREEKMLVTFQKIKKQRSVI